MTDKIIVLPKCQRCKIRSRNDFDIYCKLCSEETTDLFLEKQHTCDHYFWGFSVSKDKNIYCIYIYHDCNDLDWLKNKSVKIDLKNHDAIIGIVDDVKGVQDPPYKSGDVVSVTLK